MAFTKGIKENKRKNYKRDMTEGATIWYEVDKTGEYLSSTFPGLVSVFRGKNCTSGKAGDFSGFSGEMPQP